MLAAMRTRLVSCPQILSVLPKDCATALQFDIETRLAVPRLSGLLYMARSSHLAAGMARV
jgi:hypothetical protein